MNNGQRAMVAAMAEPNGHQGKTSPEYQAKFAISRDYLTKARTVLRYAPDLVERVRDGETPSASAQLL